MSQNIDNQEKQIQTIEYIKKLAIQLQKDQQKSFDKDSLIISQEDSLSLSFNLVFNHQKIKPKTSRQKKYLSPYNQNHLSITKIQQTSKKKAHQLIKFQNKILHQATFATQIEKRRQKIYFQTSRYTKIPALRDKLQNCYMDKLKTEAKEIYQIQSRHRKQLSPIKCNEIWSDFLLRQRRWQAQKQQKCYNLKQQYRQKSFQKAINSRKPLGFNNDDLIQKFRREKAKLQQRLKQITPQKYTQKYKSVYNQPQETSRSRSKHIRLSHSKELNFLNYKKNN